MMEHIFHAQGVSGDFGERKNNKNKWYKNELKEILKLYFTFY